MRVYIAIGTFALALLVAACGGGGKSGLPPVSVMPSTSVPGPTLAKSRRLGVTMRIPPRAQQAQSATKRPYYISPNTLSFAFIAVPFGASPNPSAIQVFPVTTPSPCATVSAGGETCTFTVQAPIGTDQFYMASFAVASPVPNVTTPLSTFVSGAVTVGGSPGPSPTPLSFTLNGVVNSVTLTVASPDPGNTPDTQVFMAAVATSVPLQITPLDASGNAIMSDAFDSPITLNITPANSGVSLVLNNPQCAGSSATARRRMQSGSPTIAIGCPTDLNAVTVSYDGSLTTDSQDQIVDTFAATASQAAPSPSPANFVLATSVREFTPAPDSGSTVILHSLPNDQIAYVFSGGTNAQYGTINALTGAMSTPISLNNTVPGGFFTMSDGSIWVADAGNNSLECYGPGGGAPTSSANFTSLLTDADDVTYDGSYIWWTGYFSSTETNFAFSVPLTSMCENVSIYDTYSFLPTTPFADPDLNAVPLSGGGIAVDGFGDGGFWTVKNPGGATYASPGFSQGNGFGGGVAVDGAATIYSSFDNTTTGYVDTLSGGTLSQLLSLGNQRPGGGMVAFSIGSGPADRLVFPELQGTLAVDESANTASPYLVQLGLNDAAVSGRQGVAVSTHGFPFVGFLNDISFPQVPTISELLLTNTWSVPETFLTENLWLTITERGDSSPFTITPVGTPPACYLGNSPTGSTHQIQIDMSGGTCTVTLKITDKNGRSQTATVTGESD